LIQKEITKSDVKDDLRSFRRETPTKYAEKRELKKKKLSSIIHTHTHCILCYIERERERDALRILRNRLWGRSFRS
jgi:hypothetical protein